MALYCGIDLHSRDCWLAILDEGLKVVQEAKVGNDLEAILHVLEPYREDLEGVAVESTFNWYWLVDGLEEAGYRMHLTNTPIFWLSAFCRKGTFIPKRNARRGICCGGERSW